MRKLIALFAILTMVACSSEPATVETTEEVTEEAVVDTASVDETEVPMMDSDTAE